MSHCSHPSHCRIIHRGSSNLTICLLRTQTFRSHLSRRNVSDLVKITTWMPQLRSGSHSQEKRHTCPLETQSTEVLGSDMEASLRRWWHMWHHHGPWPASRNRVIARHCCIEDHFWCRCAWRSSLDGLQFSCQQIHICSLGRRAVNLSSIKALDETLNPVESLTWTVRAAWDQ